MIQRLHDTHSMPYNRAVLMDTLFLHGYILPDADIDRLIQGKQCEMIADVNTQMQSLDKRHLYALRFIAQELLLAQEGQLLGKKLVF